MNKRFSVSDLEPELDIQQAAGNLRRISAILLRHWRIIAGIASTVVVLTTFVVFAISSKYTATAQVLLDPRRQNIMGASDSIISDAPMDSAVIDSQLSLIRSSALIVRIVQSQNLTQDTEFGIYAPASILSRIVGLFSFGGGERTATDSTSPSNTDNAYTREALRTITALQKALTVDRIGRTNVISISLTSHSPHKAAVLANGIANAYITDQLEARFETARTAASWLSDRLEHLRADLRASEDAVAKFRAEHNLVASVTASLNDQQLSELNGKLAASRAETAEKKAKYAQAQQILSQGGNPQAIPDVLRSQVITSLRSQQAEVTRREADLVSRYGNAHPSVINIRAERADVDRQISAEVTRIIGNLKNDYEVAQSRQKSLEDSLGILTGQTTNNSVAIRLRELERVAQANKTLYETFLGRTKITQEQENLPIRESRIISPATDPDFASYPRRGASAIFSLIIGLILGTGTAVLLEMFRRGFATPGEVEQVLEVPVLASVPLLEPMELVVQGKQIPPFRYIIAKPLSRFGEAINSLRAGIQMSDVDRPPKVIQVTSSAAHEGKSTVAASMAQSATLAYSRVLLMDCDLRRPALTKLFNLEKRPGMVDLLMGTATMENAVVRDSVSGLHLIGAGAKTQNASDMVSSERMRSFIEHLRASYDYIVVDSPPCGPVIDPVLLSQIVDKVVFAVTWNVTPREIVAQNVKLIAPEKMAGVFLSFVDLKKSPRYGSYYRYSKYYDKYYVG